ncbi:hypothetical protein [Paenibacillus spongiae]|uniref:DUF4879 domain-containing protein n=1 Tax=Paenibacillus spongiae TaxID=2909671 RepID=A0ABY5S3B9_9BACL|nr:hypothetical protein [Paenibacillus spongiae]UVI27968.1 hypothetical protein L1F29_21240 [Paenibacillus spongiae]
MKRTALAFGLMLLALSLVSVVFAASTEIIIVAESGDHKPDQLTDPNGSLGQEFIAPQTFNTLVLPLPTWSTTTSGYTFILRKHGPSGEIVYQEDIRNAQDNRSIIAVGEQGVGRYYAEISKPVGSIGWWTREDVYNRGAAYANGKPVMGSDRETIIRYVE